MIFYGVFVAAVIFRALEAIRPYFARERLMRRIAEAKTMEEIRPLRQRKDAFCYGAESLSAFQNRRDEFGAEPRAGIFGRNRKRAHFEIAALERSQRNRSDNLSIVVIHGDDEIAIVVLEFLSRSWQNQLLPDILLQKFEYARYVVWNGWTKGNGRRVCGHFYFVRIWPLSAASAAVMGFS